MIARILIVLAGVAFLVVAFELRDRLEEYGERMDKDWSDYFDRQTRTRRG